MAGLAVAPLRVAERDGPLRGVPAPRGKHIVFDDAGKAQETPSSRRRQAPRHTYFGDDGLPLPAGPGGRPQWR